MSPLDDKMEELWVTARKLHKGEDLGALAVLSEIARRLFVGHYQYGPLQLGDKRDWLKEASEEIYDAAVYFALDSMTKGNK